MCDGRETTQTWRLSSEKLLPTHRFLPTPREKYKIQSIHMLVLMLQYHSPFNRMKAIALIGLKTHVSSMAVTTKPRLLTIKTGFRSLKSACFRKMVGDLTLKESDP